MKQIVVIPGDGIGREITDAAILGKAIYSGVLDLQRAVELAE